MPLPYAVSEAFNTALPAKASELKTNLHGITRQYSAFYTVISTLFYRSPIGSQRTKKRLAEKILQVLIPNRLLTPVQILFKSWSDGCPSYRKHCRLG